MGWFLSNHLRSICSLSSIYTTLYVQLAFDDQVRRVLHPLSQTNAPTVLRSTSAPFISITEVWRSWARIHQMTESVDLHLTARPPHCHIPRPRLRISSDRTRYRLRSKQSHPLILPTVRSDERKVKLDSDATSAARREARRRLCGAVRCDVAGALCGGRPSGPRRRRARVARLPPY